MKHLLLILFFIVISATFAAGQSKSRTADKIEGCHALPWQADARDWDVGQNLPKGLKKEEFVKLLRPSAIIPTEFNPKGEIVEGVGVKPWKYLANAWVVAVETDVRVANSVGGTDSAGRYLSMAVIKRAPNSASYTVLAKTGEPFKFDDRFQFNKFDFAPFQLSESEYAFGIKRCVIYSGTGATNSYESIDLFRLSGENIEKIFSTPVKYEKSTIRGDASQDSIKKAIISVAPEKTDGYFNLIKKFGTGKPAVFRWDGKFYQTKDKDPFAAFTDTGEL